MAVNDPLGDMLTRIRNAQMRSKSKVSTPGSKLRERVLDVLKAEGYIRGYASVAHASGRSRARDRAEVFRRRAGDPRDRARLEAGPPRLCRRSRPAARQQRPRHRHPVDAEGRDVRSRRPRRECRRRSPLHACSRTSGRFDMSRIGKKAGSPSRPASPPTCDGQTVTVKGPKGALQVVLHDDVIGQDGQGRDQGRRRATRPSARARMWGMSRTHGRQPGRPA